MVYKIINADTGEVTGEIRPGDKIVRKESSEYLAQTVEIAKNETYVKVYPRTLAEVVKKLDVYSNQVLTLMMQFISYEDGILEYSNGRPLNKADICNISGLNIKTAERCIDDLIQLEVIGKHKTGRKNCYTVNPFIFMKGKRISKTLYKLYEKSRWAKLV